MDIVRRVSALTLVVTLSLIGIPLPAHAAGEESPRLTINGHALSQLLNRTAPGDPLPLAGLLGQDTGQISGVALDEDGQPLAAQAVQLKQVFTSATAEEIVAALTGHYCDEHVFVLTQNLELFDMCQTQLLACDTAFEVQLQSLTAAVTPPTTPLPPPRITRRRGNEPHFDIRPVLHHLTGVDLTQIDGLAPYSALKLIAEIGTDPTRWPTAHHFTAWLTLAPQNRVSGGRRLSSKTQPSANRAAGVLRVAAMNLIRSQTALGAFYRRLAVRIGKPKALTATARKLAILVYRTLTGRLVYRDPRGPYLQRAPTRTRVAPTPPTRRHPRLCPRQPRDRGGTGATVS